jgi:TolB-like protein
MQLRLLSGFTIEDETGRQLRLPTRKTSLLLAALALAGERGFRREALADLIWPDRAAAQARASLRQALTAVRKLLSEAGSSLVVAGDAETVRLSGSDVEIDARAFDRLADSEAPDDLGRAADLYQGNLLEGVALDGPLERWVDGYRAAFHRRALALAERLSELAEGDYAADRAAETLAGRLLMQDPAAEEAHRALIRVFLARSQQNAARRQLEQCREALRRELDADPELATLALLERSSATPPATRAAITAQDTPGERSSAASSPTNTARSEPSLVVMPFDNLSGPEDDYFVDGVVEEITAALSRVREFFVVARQSAFTYKGRFVDVREVGRELGVRYVIEGTVRRGGDQLRITVQLVDAESRSQLWSDRYEGDMADIFALQDTIASQVAGAIHPSVRASEIEAARRKPTDSLEAYDLVLRALPHVWAHTREDNHKAIAFLEQALERDPDYGEALAFKAWCHAQEACYLWSDDPASDQAAAVRLAGEAAKRIEDHATALIAIGALVSFDVVYRVI